MSPLYNLPEETLIALLKGKDQRAFNYLYDNYSGALYGVILRIVISPKFAEEVIQDVFVKIWTNFSSFDADKARIYTWMLSIARNAALDYRKLKSVKAELQNQPLPDSVNTIEEQYYTQSDQVEKMDLIGVKNVLNILKPELRILIDMAYYEGHTQQEISEILNIPLGTVKTRTRTAFLQLKSHLKDHR